MVSKSEQGWGQQAGGVSSEEQQVQSPVRKYLPGTCIVCSMSFYYLNGTFQVIGTQYLLIFLESHVTCVLTRPHRWIPSLA